jgi:ubiquinone/menaquinone biosynthesis C-methylase UbiE
MWNMDSHNWQFEHIRCNVCGSDNTRYLGVRESYSFKSYSPSSQLKIHQCKDCGLIYPNPFPFPSEIQFQENYKTPEQYFPNSLTEELLNQKLRTLKKLEAINNKKKGKLLDVGCGRGEFVYVANKNGWDAVGTETSESFAGYGNKILGVDIKVGMLDKINFPEKSFDVVTLNSVIQHSIDPKSLMEQIHRVLKQNGIIFIETANNNSLIYKTGDLYYRAKGERKTTHLSPMWPSYQVYGFTPKTLRTILINTGFHDIKVFTGFYPWGAGNPEVKNFDDKVKFFMRRIIVFLSNVVGSGQVLFALAKRGLN